MTEESDNSLHLQDYVSSHHPDRVPYSSRTSYTNQFIKSAQDYEEDLRNVYQRVIASKRNSLLTGDIGDRMDILQSGEGETAYLIEKTDQQSFITLIAGVILSGDKKTLHWMI